MDKSLFQGELVRLTTEEPQTMAEAFSRWERNSEFHRLLDSDPARIWSVKKFKEWVEKDNEKSSSFEFTIRSLTDGRLIGFVGLFGLQWNHGDAWVGIGLGERQDWGMGYGTDAMRLILHYGFTELNLHRVTLGVFEYNPRAIRSYEKAGFRHEGRLRQVLHRDRQRCDVLQMGILRREWEAMRET